MSKKKTIREIIDESIALYDKGKWEAALNLLRPLLKHRLRRRDRCEALMHIGWNFWKSGRKAMASDCWEAALGKYADRITLASAHAGLGIYYATALDKAKALHHAKLAQELLPEKATMNQSMNLNACGIALAKLGELDRAKDVLQKVMEMNERLEKEGDSDLARRAKHQRAKNGYNLSSLVFMKQGKLEEALKELLNEVIPRYIAVDAQTDLAAAYHQVAAIHESRGNFPEALHYEEMSKEIWDKHRKDDPKRSETAAVNIARIEEKMQNTSVAQSKEMAGMPKNTTERDKENK